jgi:archaemetzincin
VLDAVDDAAEIAACYPAPLVLPDDELAHDPGYEGQSLRSWIDLGARNAVTARRKTLYVAKAPVIEDDVSFMNRWTTPVGTATARQKAKPKPLDPDHVVEYLAAFYHGLPVKPFPREFRFVPWDDKPAKKKAEAAQSFVGVAVGNSCTRVRARPSPDGKFTRQLQLTDILDALIENLPADAFAVILLLDHDLYEDDEDDFCCGRAYGGSRVCVVSSARYRPELDDSCDIDLEHMWPASHCVSYINNACGIKKPKPRSKSKSKSNLVPSQERDEAHLKPLRAAVEAAKKAPAPAEDPYGLWLSRYVRTAAHELGHCFALDHCVWYACMMQSTSCMEEDVRQPPYLCPVCAKKVTRAILDVNRGVKEDAYRASRDMELLDFCNKWKGNSMFAGYAGWLEAMLNRSWLE